MDKRFLAFIVVLVLVASVFIFFNEDLLLLFNGGILIRADGSVAGTDKISCDGNVYTFTGNISEGIKVQKSNIVIDGAGYTLLGNSKTTGIDLTNGRGQDGSRNEIHDVTIKNLYLVATSISCANSRNNTFVNNYFYNSRFDLWGSNNTLKQNTFLSGGVMSLYSGVNSVTGNNFVNSSFNVGPECPDPVVDGNYWSDYTTRYPNATEIGNTGVWNTSYMPPSTKFSQKIYTDYHPRVEPISGIEPSTSTATTQGNSTVALLAISATVITIAVAACAILIYLKKLKPARKVRGSVFQPHPP